MTKLLKNFAKTLATGFIVNKLGGKDSKISLRRSALAALSDEVSEVIGNRNLDVDSVSSFEFPNLARELLTLSEQPFANEHIPNDLGDYFPDDSVTALVDSELIQLAEAGENAYHELEEELTELIDSLIETKRKVIMHARRSKPVDFRRLREENLYD